MRCTTIVRSAISTPVLLLLAAPFAWPVVDGVTGQDFSLSAREVLVSAPHGDIVPAWSYALTSGNAQLPGPTLIVTQGNPVSVTLTNELGVGLPNVSLLFPGQMTVASGGVAGVLTREAPPGWSVTYSFVPDRPGTYLYHSGTSPALQVEMGLVGALVVRPAAGGKDAYGHPSSEYDREALLLLSEIDPVIHNQVDQQVRRGDPITVDLTDRDPKYWLINGRSFPDTLAPFAAAWLPTQPYTSLLRMEPGERLLVRVIGGGSLSHPLHFHANQVQVIARNGRLLSSFPGAGADLGTPVSTLEVMPGETVDVILTWSGAGLGWDIYGTSPLPVALPASSILAFESQGSFYSGSPFLGQQEPLPVGITSFNESGEYYFMLSSQNANELLAWDTTNLGMLSMLRIDPPDTLPPE